MARRARWKSGTNSTTTGIGCHLKASVFSDQITGRMPELLEEAHEFPEGRSREAIIRVRVNQGFFRAAVLASYSARCCITGLSIPQLLMASHIVPWSVDAKNRTNPQNGLCLNAIHDRAFDCGLLTVTTDLKVKLSPRVPKD